MSLSQSFSQKIGNVRPLNPCPSLDIDFANGGYVNTGGFANQESVGSANFKIGAFNGPDPIFTRATAATFRGSNGLIQYAPENLLQWSEDFSNGNWVRTGIAAFGSGSVSNAVLAPNNELTADLIVEDTTTGVHRIESLSALAMTANDIAAFSVFVKMYGSTNEVGISFRDGGLVIFNLASKTYLTYQQPPSGTVLSSSIDDVGNGWFRLQSTIQSVGSYNRRAGVQLCLNGQPSYQGSSSRGAYVWGMQLERSSTVRPYISTTATARYGPRFEYDLSGNPLGLLMEEQSQNLLQYSEQFDNAAWLSTQLLAFGSGSIVNATTAPNGTITADLITPSTTLSTHGIWQAAVTVASGVSCTATWYVKPNGYTKIAIVENQLTGYYTSYDASASGSVLSQSNATGAITVLANGWYRITHTSVSGGTSFRPQLFILSPAYTGGSVIGAWAANGTSGIYIWGAQLEQKPFATSYMPTVGGTSTRNADVVSSTISSWFNQPEGTIVVSGDRSHSPSLNTSLYDSFYEFGDGGGGYHSAHFSDGTAEEFFGDNGAYATSAVGITTIGTLTSIASSYSSNDIYTTRDGITPNSAASATFLATPVTLSIGYSQALTQAWNGHIKTFRYYPKALPDKLQRLSS